MAKICYDKGLNIDVPTIILKNRDLTNIGKLIVSELKHRDNFASANKLSFKVYKFLDEKLNSKWNDVNDYNVIYVPEYDEYFDMQVSLNEKIGTYKAVTCTALAESELTNTKLYNIEINTEADISRDDYDADYPTVFYRDFAGYEVGSDMYNKLKNASLLHRILDKASNYEIGHIDESLQKLNIWYQFSISDSNIYDTLTGDVAEQYNCLFTFKIKEDGRRIVNAYDLYNTCGDCGYRGEFYDECPECYSTNFSGAYGKDTTIFSSKENLATSSSIESNKDQLKNCFRVSGGDDLVTSTISGLNPNGSNYLYYFSPEMLASMPQSLKDNIEAYNILSAEYLNEKVFELLTTNVDLYNKVIDYIKERYPEEEYEKITTSIAGYKNIAILSYNIIDLLGFLEHSMMPTPDISLDGQTIEDAKNLLTTANLSPVAITDPSSSGAETLSDNAVLAMAKILVNTALYKVEIDTSTYVYNSTNETGTWNGVFKLTSIRDEDNTVKTDFISIVVDGNVERYVQQKIKRTLAKEDDAIREITDIELPYIEDKNDVNYKGSFLDRITYYSSTYLNGTYEAFETCCGIITESNNEDLKANAYQEYQKRMTAVSKELSLRLEQIENVGLLNSEISKIQSDTRNALDFETFLNKDGKDLWRVFCSYRREDSYQNDNFISDGLTNNAELIERTQQLIDEAQKELYKAGNLQYNISSTLNNLLALKEFQPIVDDFECGNWIHVMIDEKLYTLRLLSYEIDYDNLDKISVEFSTVTKIWSGVSDVNDVLDSAQSIAGSYSSTISQVKQSTKATKYVNNWTNEGMSLTTTKIVNNADSQDIVINKTGILCRSYDDIKMLYDDYQFKIISNGAYFTRNNWKTVEAGIGRIYYKDPETKQEIEDYGIIAKTVLGKLFIGEKLKIYNESGSLKFDEDGFTVTNDKYTVIINPNDNQLFKITKGTDNIFYTDTDGNLRTTGIINATGGEIGGWTIGTDNLSYGESSKDGYMLIKPSTNTILSTGDYGRSLLTSGALKFERKINGQDIGIAKFNSTAWLTKPNVYGVGINSEVDSKFISFGNKNTNSETSYSTKLLLNYGLNPYIDSNDTSKGQYIEDIIVYGTSRFTNDAYFNNRIVFSNGFYLGNLRDGSTQQQIGIYCSGQFMSNGDLWANSIYENGLALSSKYLALSGGTVTGNVYLAGGTSYYLNSNGSAKLLRIACGGASLSTAYALYVGNTNHSKIRGRLYFGDYNDDTYFLGMNGSVYANEVFASGRQYKVSNSNGTGNIAILGLQTSDNYAFVGNDNLTGLCLKGITIKFKNSNGATVVSDERLKNSFRPLDEFDEVFMDLTPTAFKFNNGTSGRFHFGFKAQQVKDSLLKHNFTTKDFAGFVQMSDNPNSEDYCGVDDPMGLIYTEFTSWNTHMIQKTIRRLDSLEEKISLLKEENAQLKSQIVSLQEQINTILNKLEAVG